MVLQKLRNLPPFNYTGEASLFAWIAKHAGRGWAKRAIESGEAELLGGFDKIPPSSLPGWVVRLKSPLGREGLVAVLIGTPHYYMIEIGEVPEK